MNKAELVAKMSQISELSKTDTEKALKAFTETVTDALYDGDKVTITGFATLETADVEERECRNPKTGGTATSPAHKKIRVKISKSLKDSVNGR